jgi:uncharacterized protein (DUF1800 family)
MTDPRGPWVPYVPHASAPWDLGRVVRLRRRAGFAATWDEIQRDLDDGPEASVGRLLSGKARIRGVPQGFEAKAAVLAETAVASGDAGRLKAWWVYRMLYGPDPLGERLVLLWHDHFATSVEKVNDLGWMRRQNETFRRHARAPFGELLRAVIREPSSLVWLDAQANSKGSPNENLARELMELFTLGIGHYTEADVKEAARALTGWTVAGDSFREDPSRHDDGEKVVLGRRGRWTGTDLAAMLLEHPATAERLAWRICDTFLGEGDVDAAGIRDLASGLRECDLDIGRAVGTVLRSRAFHEGRGLRGRVVSPVEFVIGSVRALELFDPAPGTLLLAEWATRLGQDLFYPPNVGGWPGGRAWLSAGALIGRANYAAALARGRDLGVSGPPDVLALSERLGFGRDLGAVTGFASSALLGVDARKGGYPSLDGAPRSGLAEPDAACGILRRILASPEAQKS